MGVAPGTSGYIPTYGLSSPHWDSATTITHGSAADSQHINMIYGTVPSGPGFIAGFVVSGAGRTTSGDIPAPGMTVFLLNAAGHVVSYAITATDGTYSFSHLPNGTYRVWPEAYKYYTTPSAAVTLATGSDSLTHINFKQHTSYGTITPYTSSQVHSMAAAAGNGGPGIYPNPASNTLNIQWSAKAGMSAEVTIVNVVGREVLHTFADIDKNTGNSQLDISAVNEGVYLVNIKSEGASYTSRLVISRN
jgi:hypothetical protein